MQFLDKIHTVFTATLTVTKVCDVFLKSRCSHGPMVDTRDVLSGSIGTAWTELATARRNGGLRPQRGPSATWTELATEPLDQKSSRLLPR